MGLGQAGVEDSIADSYAGDSLTMPSLTRIIRPLEKQSLIERRPEERDLRAAVLSVSHAAETRYDEIVSAFGLERLERLHIMLDELSEALSK